MKHISFRQFSLTAIFFVSASVAFAAEPAATPSPTVTASPAAKLPALQKYRAMMKARKEERKVPEIRIQTIFLSVDPRKLVSVLKTVHKAQTDHETHEQLVAKFLPPKNSSSKTLVKHSLSSLFAHSSSNPVELLSAPSVTTKLGQECLVEVIKECRYWNVFSPVFPTPVKGKIKLKPILQKMVAKHHAYVLPQSLTTRNIGISLDIKPLSVIDNRCEIQIQPKMVRFLKDENFGGYVKTETVPSADLTQPLFSTKTATTRQWLTFNVPTVVLIDTTDPSLKADEPGHFALVVILAISKEELPAALKATLR